MNAFEFIDAVRNAGGSVELDAAGKVCIRAFPGEIQIAALNRDALRDVLASPGRWPCRRFASHPTDPKLPCRSCGDQWAAHSPDLRRQYDRPPLLAEAAAVVAAALAESSMERAS